MDSFSKPRSVFLLNHRNYSHVYNQVAVDAIQEMTLNDGVIVTAEDLRSDPKRYADVELAFSTWGAPVLDAELLDRLPSLKALFYAAGSVRAFVTDAFWERKILLTSAYRANAVPVAEYTMASVIFALKRAWQWDRRLKSGRSGRDGMDIPGVYSGSQVGVISLGAIGRLVCERLSALDLDVLAYDPFAEDALFESVGAERVGKLEDLFARCDVVTLHAPWLKETEKMVTGPMLRSMPKDATFINTSRGAIVDEPAMIEVLSERPDVFAVLDLLEDESTFHSSPLTTMPNVFITPHIAGSQGRECHRMGALAVEECRRYLKGEPPLTGLTKESAARLA